MAEKLSQQGTIPLTITSLDTPCETFYKVFGDLSADPALIILHGGPGGGHSYLLPFAKLWPQYGIPVILYDQLGCAASTHLPHTAGDTSFWTMELFIHELINLIDHLGLRNNGYHILGHSWGGMLASDFAARRPEGLRRLVLASSLASTESNIQGVQSLRSQLDPDAQAAVTRAEEMGDWESVKEIQALLSRRHICRAETLPPELVGAFQNLSEEGGGLVVYRAMYATSWLSPDRKASLGTWSSIPRLPQIAAPTLVYNGEYDTSHDVTTVPLFELIPRVRWITFPNIGHMCHLEDRERVLKTVGDFLVKK